MPLQATSGAASYDGFGGGVAAVPNYIEECFSTTLYTGNSSSSNPIVNGIDLAGKGGLIWLKSRDNGDSAASHVFTDTVRGGNKVVLSNSTAAEVTTTAGTNITSFNSNGFTLGNTYSWYTNYIFSNQVSWTFRRQPKFFDVVTYTGNGTSPRNISHSLASVPGFIVGKSTSAADGWRVYHRSLSSNATGLQLNSTTAGGINPYDYGDTSTVTTPTSTQFTVGDNLNANGTTYVAYLFAHNAGGFGLTGTDNVISCGSFTYDATNGNSINLGYEPQWVLIKRATGGTGNWVMQDVMRGMVSGPSSGNQLLAQSSAAETDSYLVGPTATGFNIIPSYYNTGDTIIYIAIRRGPMKVPTDATKVFTSVARSGTSATATITAGFPVDLEISKTRNAGNPSAWFDRLRGATYWLRSSGTNAEATTADSLTSFASNTGVTVGADAGDGIINFNTSTYANWMFGRAPSFFDEVCYTGTEVSGQTFTHNLGVVPEMMIVKARDGTTDWTVYHSALGASARIYLNLTNAANTGTAAPWNSTTPTSSVFSLGNAGATNLSGTKFVNYLFATCAGVSKVGTYTGNGTGQTIDCGFTSGARFVLIKITSTTGSWSVWDTARGITTGDDPSLLLNSTAAESTAPGVSPASSGFALTNSFNGNGATYIFLAIA